MHCTKFVDGWGQYEGVKGLKHKEVYKIAILLLLKFFLKNPVNIEAKLEITNLQDYKHTATYIHRESLNLRTYKITNIQHHTYLGRA